MMKRWVAMMLAVGLICLSAAGMAAGQLTVGQFAVVLNEDADGGFFFARVENTGDETVSFDRGQLVLHSSAGDVLLTEDMVLSSPIDVCLQPGEYAYVSERLWLDDLKGANLGDVDFTVKSRSWQFGETFDRLALQGEYVQEANGESYILMTLKNETDQMMGNFRAVCAMMTADDRLLYVEDEDYDNLMIHPGSTVTLRLDVDSSVAYHYSMDEMKPEKVEAFVYLKKR